LHKKLIDNWSPRRRNIAQNKKRPMYKARTQKGQEDRGWSRPTRKNHVAASNLQPYNIWLKGTKQFVISTWKSFQNEMIIPNK